MHYVNRLCIVLCAVALMGQKGCFESDDNSHTASSSAGNSSNGEQPNTPDAGSSKNTSAKQLLQKLVDHGIKVAKASSVELPQISDELLERISAQMAERCSEEEIASVFDHYRCLQPKEDQELVTPGVDSSCLMPGLRYQCMQGFGEAVKGLMYGTFLPNTNSNSQALGTCRTFPNSLIQHPDANMPSKKLCFKSTLFYLAVADVCADFTKSTMQDFDRCTEAAKANCTDDEINKYVDFLDTVLADDGSVLPGAEIQTFPRIRFQCVDSMSKNTSDVTAKFNSIQPTTPPALSNVLHVSSNARGTNDGSSWANAFTNLQNAVEESHGRFKEDGVTRNVWVMTGIYTNESKTDEPVLTMREGVTVIGWYISHGPTTHGFPEDTLPVLDGQHRSTHVVIGASNAALIGFKIINGSANKNVSYIDSKVGAGLYASHANNLVLNYIYFEGNRASLTGDDMYLENSQAYCSSIQTKRAAESQTANEGVYLRNSVCSGEDNRLESWLSVNHSTFGSITEPGGDESLGDLWKRRGETKKPNS